MRAHAHQRPHNPDWIPPPMLHVSSIYIDQQLLRTCYDKGTSTLCIGFSRANNRPNESCKPASSFGDVSVSAQQFSVYILSVSCVHFIIDIIAKAHQIFTGSRDDVMNHPHYGCARSSIIHGWSATSARSVEYLSTSSISAVPVLKSVNAFKQFGQ